MSILTETKRSLGVELNDQDGDNKYAQLSPPKSRAMMSSEDAENIVLKPM